uniref:Eukaryotic translation initiation factor 3 subunit G-2-like n=1 Tax=Diabrotica virgifera virgifera TaxID=50390 RepID=A0A6P7H5A4_DIAVI
MVLSVGETGKQGSKCVPPNLRDEGVKRTDGSGVAKRYDSYCAIRIANLSESTTETDLEDLVKQFGPIKKLYLEKDNITGGFKGICYFKFRSHAAKAIAMLHGHGYDHLILNVDYWSKPSPNSNQ